MKIEEIFSYLTSEEDVTLPKDGNGNFIIPSRDKKHPELARPVKDLAVQTSKYHKEDLLQHVSAVTGAMVSMAPSSLMEKTYFMIGLFHDIAKKLCIGVSKNNEICFYNHELESAKLCNIKFGITDIRFIAVIENHLKIKSEDFNHEQFAADYGQSALNALEALNKADVGFDPAILEDAESEKALEIASYIYKFETIFDEIKNTEFDPNEFVWDI